MKKSIIMLLLTGCILASQFLLLYPEKTVTATKQLPNIMEQLHCSDSVTISKNEIAITSATPGSKISEPQFIALPVALPVDIQQSIASVCDEYNISFSFIMAMIYTESRFQVNAKSRYGDYGLMQINKMNHAWIAKATGVTNFLDPIQNVTAGCYMLAQLFEKYEEPHLVLMAYNLGEQKAKSLWKQNIYSTAYSRQIVNLEMEYSSYIDQNEIN